MEDMEAEDGKARVRGAGDLQGWTRRSILDEPRLSEMAKTYRALGYEVRLVDHASETMGECTVCLEGNPDIYKIIYTRSGRKVGSDLSEELYD